MQVMANLLSNAAKFSSRGAEVSVRASVRGTHVRIEVEDRGLGIPEEFRARVFDKFAQADSSTSRHFEGTGLGLSITRQLVEAMGAQLGSAPSRAKALPSIRTATSRSSAAGAAISRA